MKYDSSHAFGMTNMNDIEIIIKSLGGLGDGIGSHNGKPVFVAKACAGDRVSVRVVHENHEGYHAVVTGVHQAGAERQAPPCIYFDRCGGCVLQQLVPESYKTFKTRMLQSALKRAGLEVAAEVIFLPPDRRRRVEFKIAHESGKPRLAFYELRSHTPVLIDHCLILRPELQAMIDTLNEALLDVPMAQMLRGVKLTLADSGVDATLVFRDQLPLVASLKGWNPGFQRLSVRLKDEPPKLVYETSPVTMRLGEYDIPLPSDAFLQATAEGQALLTKAVVEGLAGATSVADLFCGIGTYSFSLAAQAKVHAVEGDQAMVAAIKARGAQGISYEKRDLFKRPLTANELKRFDGVAINPPRLGAKAQCEEIAKSDVKKLVMISCNPPTFARDAKILKAGGYTLQAVRGIDQFVFSAHLEIVAVFMR